MAEQIVNECNTIIAKTMSGRKYVDMSKGEQDSTKPQGAIKGVWEEKNNVSDNVELKKTMMVSYETIISQGENIDYSNLLKVSLDGTKENLDKCIPRTIEEREYKKALMLELYEEKTNNGVLRAKAETFIEEQTKISDEQQEIVSKYFALLNILEAPQEKFSIEEMSGDIKKLQENFVRQEEKKYIRNNIYDVFSKHGYDIDVAKWMKEEPCDVKYPDLQYAQCRIISLDNEFLFESYGVIDHAGEIRFYERKRIMNDEIEICKRHLEIEEELKARGILLSKRYSFEPAEEKLKYKQVCETGKKRITNSSISEGKL